MGRDSFARISLVGALLAGCSEPTLAERCTDYIKGTLGECGADLDVVAFCEDESQDAEVRGCQAEMELAYSCLNDALSEREVTCRLDGTDDWGQVECETETGAYFACMEGD